jgi:chromosomal replication initiator protein
MTKDWVTLYYSDLLDEGFRSLGIDNYQLNWMIEKSETPEERFAEADANAESRQAEPAAAMPDFAPRNSPVIVRNASTNFVDMDPVENSLNPKYTFEKFVVGSSNQFAHAASLAAAESPGKTYNPLFIYGGVGLGKTHLMHAIGHSIKERNKHLRVSYITSEKFMNELINAIRYDKTPHVQHAAQRPETDRHHERLPAA